MGTSQKISWTAADHIKVEKSSDWFWIVGIVGIGGAILAIYFNNLLFALLLLIGIFTMFMQKYSHPKDVNFEINRKGLKVNEFLYPYASLQSFWVIDEDGWDRDRILLKSKKTLMPLIIIPLGEDNDPDQVRDYLLEYLDEEQMEESLIEKIGIILGF